MQRLFSADNLYCILKEAEIFAFLCSFLHFITDYIQLFLRISFFCFLSVYIILSALFFGLITCAYIQENETQSLHYMLKRNKLCLFSRLTSFIITKWMVAHHSTLAVVNVVRFATPYLHLLSNLLAPVTVVCVRKHSAPPLAFLLLLT
jgi:hypothetical protein